MRHPMRSSAARTRRALIAGQLLTQHLKRDVEGRRWQFGVLDPICNHLDGQPLGVADGILARLPVGHYSGEFQRLGNPAAVIFPVDLNGKVHLYNCKPDLGSKSARVTRLDRYGCVSAAKLCRISRRSTPRYLPGGAGVSLQTVIDWIIVC